jgi:hypothetical protein
MRNTFRSTTHTEEIMHSFEGFSRLCVLWLTYAHHHQRTTRIEEDKFRIDGGRSRSHTFDLRHRTIGNNLLSWMWRGIHTFYQKNWKELSRCALDLIIMCRFLIDLRSCHDGKHSRTKKQKWLVVSKNNFKILKDDLTSWREFLINDLFLHFDESFTNCLNIFLFPASMLLCYISNWKYNAMKCAPLVWLKLYMSWFILSIEKLWRLDKFMLRFLFWKILNTFFRL